jgi:hypothetical protein
MSLPAPENHVSENLAHPRHAPLLQAGSGLASAGLANAGLANAGLASAGLAGLGLPGWGLSGWGLAQAAGPETAILATPSAASHAAAPRFAALRLLAEEHVAAHGGSVRPLGTPPQALLVRTARDQAEALDARLRLLLGEDAVASFDLPEQAETLSERLTAERAAPEPGFAVSLASPSRPLLRLAPPLVHETLAAALAALDALPPAPPPLLALPLAALRDDAFLRFAARHRRRAGAGRDGLVAAVPLADLLASAHAAGRAAAALAHAGHRLAAALPPQALRLFDLSTIPVSLLVTPWDPAWECDDPALSRAGAARVLATGVDSAAAISACRAAGIGAVAGRAAARLLAANPIAPNRLVE